MNKADAMDRLTALAQANIHPTLTPEEVGTCLDGAKAGAAWDLNRAAQSAWEMKAAKSTDHHMATVAGRRFDAKQVHENCLAMAKMYRNRNCGTV